VVLICQWILVGEWGVKSGSVGQEHPGIIKTVQAYIAAVNYIVLVREYTAACVSVCKKCAESETFG